uniref:Uncharacterized protein n=2 Tax=Hemiselmis andersenii TaxID=464988 RepID=A0A6U2G3X3_HEMAN|mmetsp:Transcript_35232/g.82507  ORF Transcript_35232/g.82507 Transcript_35232/m.82507 type:complete len:196 (+) Transcript_35232:1109-1696(+)
MHYLLERPWKEGGGGLSYEFLVRVEGESSFETNPLYAIMHESIYCSGAKEGSQWSAGRRIDPRFDYKKTLADPNGQVMMFGEHTFEWMYEDYASLRGLKDAAHFIAGKKDWGKLYDAEALKKSTVPSAAAVYYDDVYVEHDLSVKTAALTGSGKGGSKMKIWVTNEYQHSGLRDDGYRILDRLLGMIRGTHQVPS